MTGMKSTDKTGPVGRIKAECLAILDRVAESGKQVTKRGKPVARVVPIETGGAVSLVGSVTFHGDIVAPILDDWDFNP